MASCVSAPRSRGTGGLASPGTVGAAPNPGGTVSLAGGSHVVITCLVCEEKIRTWRGHIRCGAEYPHPRGAVGRGADLRAALRGRTPKRVSRGRFSDCWGQQSRG